MTGSRACEPSSRMRRSAHRSALLRELEEVCDVTYREFEDPNATATTSSMASDCLLMFVRGQRPMRQPAETKNRGDRRYEAADIQGPFDRRAFSVEYANRGDVRGN